MTSKQTWWLKIRTLVTWGHCEETSPSRACSALVGHKLLVDDGCRDRPGHSGGDQDTDLDGIGMVINKSSKDFLK